MALGPLCKNPKKLNLIFLKIQGVVVPLLGPALHEDGPGRRCDVQPVAGKVSRTPPEIFNPDILSLSLAKANQV